MDNLISRQAAINEFYHIKHILQMMDDSQNADKTMQGLLLAQDAVKKLPPAQTEITLEQAVDRLYELGWIQEHDRVLTESAQDRKKGNWTEKEVIHNVKPIIIEEWQSARCSVCGKYHTTPYLYFFDNYNFCPNCGADMMP